MTKWFVYIVFVLILTPWLSFAKIHPGSNKSIHQESIKWVGPSIKAVADTTPKSKKQQEADDKKKVKEVTKAKRLPKPEKVDETDAQKKVKPKRQRRPPGMERPPEIPRRNGN